MTFTDTYSVGINHQDGQKKKLNIGDKSSLITVQGSGARGFKSLHANKIATSDYGTNSRGYFYALNRFIDKAIDTATGGPPQISCIYNIGGAMTIGVICKGERYVFGLNIPPSEEMNDIRWVNNKFESCDGKIMKKKKTAQAQPIPTKLLGKEPT